MDNLLDYDRLKFCCCWIVVLLWSICLFCYFHKSQHFGAKYVCYSQGLCLPNTKLMLAIHHKWRHKNSGMKIAARLLLLCWVFNTFILEQYGMLHQAERELNLCKGIKIVYSDGVLEVWIVGSFDWLWYFCSPCDILTWLMYSISYVYYRWLILLICFRYRW